MKLAVVAGGWHWPAHFFHAISQQASGADLFAVAHRSPDLSIVREEKRGVLLNLPGKLGELDRELYREYATTRKLKSWGWQYQEEPNTCGDWEFFNQWLAGHDYRKYDVILNCHDDTYIRSGDLLSTVKRIGPMMVWLLANGRYPEAPKAYVRGSFEFWRRELLDELGGRIPLGDIALTREGKTDTPEGLDALSSWNDTAVPLRNFMIERGIEHQVGSLSQFYRISPFAIEGERGLLSNQGGAPWSFNAGVEAYLK